MSISMQQIIAALIAARERQRLGTGHPLEGALSPSEKERLGSGEPLAQSGSRTLEFREPPPGTPLLAPQTLPFTPLPPGTPPASPRLLGTPAATLADADLLQMAGGGQQEITDTISGASPVAPNQPPDPFSIAGTGDYLGEITTDDEGNPIKPKRKIDFVRLAKDIANAFSQNANQRPLFETDLQRDMLGLRERTLEESLSRQDERTRIAQAGLKLRERDVDSLIGARDPETALEQAKELAKYREGLIRGRQAAGGSGRQKFEDFPAAALAQFEDSRLAQAKVIEQGEAGLLPILGLTERGEVFISNEDIEKAGGNKQEALARRFDPYVNQVVDRIIETYPPEVAKEFQKIKNQLPRLKPEERGRAIISLIPWILDVQSHLNGVQFEGEDVQSFFTPKEPPGIFSGKTLIDPKEVEPAGTGIFGIPKFKKKPDELFR